MADWLWYNVKTGEVREASEQPGPEWRFLIHKQRLSHYNYYLFRDRSGEYRAVRVSFRRPVCCVLEDYQKEGVCFEDAVKFLEYDRVARNLIQYFPDRVKAFSDAELLAKYVSKRLREARCHHDQQVIVRYCMELERILDVQLLPLVDPEVLLKLLNL